MARIHLKDEYVSTAFRRALVVGGLVLIMFAATIVEAGMWALTNIALGAFSVFEEALCFSMVTYATLGYGDVVLVEQSRLLSSFQAANGAMMFGWTTGVSVLAIKDISKSVAQLRDSHSCAADMSTESKILCLKEASAGWEGAERAAVAQSAAGGNGTGQGHFGACA
ncbi:MAG: two pore domain potassium channel family protein [Betaproteobacteria bacterium]|nr:MAG: two pore domain potassium channel family protein [Betaproteobacteria bacterium]